MAKNIRTDKDSKTDRVHMNRTGRKAAKTQIKRTERTGGWDSATLHTPRKSSGWKTW